jgi:hypothetical protein
MFQIGWGTDQYFVLDWSLGGWVSFAWAVWAPVWFGGDQLCLMADMFSRGWGLMGRLGSGGGSWECGGEDVREVSVFNYLLTFPCRLSLHIGGSGSQTLAKATLSGDYISSWLLMFRLLRMLQKISFGILRCPWRFPSTRGVYYVTGYPQKQTWLLETSYLLQLTFA